MKQTVTSEMIFNLLKHEFPQAPMSNLLLLSFRLQKSSPGLEVERRLPGLNSPEPREPQVRSGNA